MYSKGHAGLTLAIVSLLMIPFGWSEYPLFIIGIAVALSALPDIDLKWMKYSVSIQGKDYRVKHRGNVTHSLFFALAMGSMLGGLFYWSIGSLLWFVRGFSGAFLGVTTHLLGDTLTYHEFQPLWPFSKKSYAYGFCGAGDRKMNDGLMTIGIIGFLLYFSVTTGLLMDLVTSSFT
jgi:membrane-bound metal-dependent hydrolase YbcI (DUF457 family)